MPNKLQVFQAEQDASKLNLGPDFADAQSLTMAEAKLVVEAVREARKIEYRGEEPPMSEYAASSERS